MLEIYTGTDIFFMSCAGIGGSFVLLRVFMQIFGSHMDVDADHSFDVDHSDSDASFKMLSLQAVSSFLLMFGLIGFALHHQSRLGMLISLAGGTVAGWITVWLIGKIFIIANKMQSSGTLTNDHALGAEGTVYLTIPKDGIGRVLINFNDRLREFDAVSQNNEEIKTDEPIFVVSLKGNTLVVDKNKSDYWR